MKELSIEEKAKAYDEALERAKEILEYYKHPAYSEVYAYAKEDIPGIFPELAENEDERIYQDILDYCYKRMNNEISPITIHQVERWLSWLEKQKEPKDKGEISDGYHTFNELYRYRMLYNAAFFNLLPKEIVHKSKRHHDGEECFGGGWFIVMANLPTGQISNHYELKDWDLFQIPEKEVADEWDGHTPQEAADRLHEYLLEKQSEQESAWSEKDEKILNAIINDIQERHPEAMWKINAGRTVAVSTQYIIDWLKKQREKPQGKSIIKAWKDMRFEVYAQASGNRREPNCSDNNTEMFSLNDIDEIIEKIAIGNIGQSGD